MGILNLQKHRRIVDPKAIKKVKEIGYCEYCGNGMRELQAHHIKSKGAGGHDVSSNLICLCYVCHRTVHDGNIGRDVLREIVGRRG